MILFELFVIHYIHFFIYLTILPNTLISIQCILTPSVNNFRRKPVLENREGYLFFLS